MQAVTITQITPPELEVLIENSLKKILSQSYSKQIETESDTWFDLDALRQYHPDRPAAATVYTWVSKNEIPYHKRGKKLSFLKSEVDAWLKAGRYKTLSEIDEAADNAILKNNFSAQKI